MAAYYTEIIYESNQHFRSFKNNMKLCPIPFNPFKALIHSWLQLPPSHICSKNHINVQFFKISEVLQANETVDRQVLNKMGYNSC